MVLASPFILGLLLAVIRYSRIVRSLLGAVLLAVLVFAGLCLVEVCASRYIVPALVCAVLYLVIRAFAERSARS